MIARLAGLLAVRSPDGIIVDVGGVGYEVICPLTTVRALPDVGEPVVLHTVAQMNDDGIRLFGFTSDMDRVLFQKLIGVNGIGPKMAVTILSGAEASDLVAAIRSGDTVLLNRIPGVGKKTAERIVLELKGALDALTPPPRSDRGGENVAWGARRGGRGAGGAVVPGLPAGRGGGDPGIHGEEFSARIGRGTCAGGPARAGAAKGVGSVNG